MQQTSPSYNPYTDERYVGIGITFSLVDQNAAGNATATATDATAFSTPQQLIAESVPPGKIPTLELNQWDLGGTWSIAPDNLSVPYWTSAYSDENGEFATPPSVTVQLSSPASSVGFTLRFDTSANLYPSSVQITAYAGSSQLAQQTFSVSSQLFVADMPVNDYDKVVFSFLSTSLPYRRVRLYGLVFGITQSFDPSTIVSATFVFGSSIDCSSIPSRQLVFTFDNSDAAYNFLNPQGIYEFLQDGQAISAELTINGETVDMGDHYYTEAKAEDEALTAQITANDSVLQLDDQTYDAGQSGTWTFAQAVSAILGSAPVDIPSSVASTTVGRAIPIGTTLREALRLVSQAACVSCWINRSGTYVFRDLTVVGTPVDTLDADNVYSLASIGVGQYYDCVKVTVRDEFADTDPVEYTAGSGTNVKTYSNPCVVNGQTVANWLLSANALRLRYTPRNRGNPAVDTGDTLTIYNAYGESGTAVVTSQKLTYNGGLYAQTEATGGRA